MRLILMLAAVLVLAACAHKEKGPPPLPAHPVGEVNAGALPPPAELSAPAPAPAAQDNKDVKGSAAQ